MEQEPAKDVVGPVEVVDPAHGPESIEVPPLPEAQRSAVIGPEAGRPNPADPGPVEAEPAAVEPAVTDPAVTEPTAGSPEANLAQEPQLPEPVDVETSAADPVVPVAAELPVADPALPEPEPVVPPEPILVSPVVVAPPVDVPAVTPAAGAPVVAKLEPVEPDELASPPGRPAADLGGSHTRGIRRILIVAAVALAAFGAAIVTLADDARRGCVAEAQRDPTYQARLVGVINVEKTDYDLAVTRNGVPVRGAKVCASVSMRGMSGMAVSDTADEVEPGVYKVSIVLEMSGSWQGNILITEQGKPAASVPLTFNVS
ncbi:MAG: FixH family protein [Acidimicrobiales bacterium]